MQVEQQRLAPRFDYLVQKAVRATVETFRQTWTSAGGVTYRKTNKHMAEDAVLLKTLIEILDHVFRWEGMDELTRELVQAHPVAIENRLRLLAVEQGTLKFAPKAFPRYTLPQPEDLTVRVK